MNQIIDINGRAIERIEYKAQPVITLPMMDELHERPEGTAGRNYRQNKKHMIEGEDFFSVPQDEVQKLFGRRISSAKRGGHRGDQVLLTKSGYGMLVKSFNDDLAWKVQRALVNHYFAVQQLGGPDRRIGIDPARIDNAPNGLNISYTVDLTKIIARPSRRSMMILSRLTGIDLEDIAIMPNDKSLTAVRSRLQADVEMFFLEESIPEEGTMTSATILYNAFINWTLTRSPEEKIPTQKVFGAMAGNLSLEKGKVDGIIKYFDIRLKDPAEGNEKD